MLAACHLDLDAAVDCYGAFVTGEPPAGYPLRVTNLVDQLPELRGPLLGLFGEQDANPSPEQVAELEQILTERQGVHEFHSYDDAGHGFFAVDRPAYRVAAANDGWERIAAFFAEHLPREADMCTYATVTDRRSTAAPRDPAARWFHVTDGAVYFDHPVHAMAEHTLNIDFADPAPGRRRGSRSSSPRPRRGR